MAYTFQGVDPSSSLTGNQALTNLQGIFGRKLKDSEIGLARSAGKYTDPSGNAAMTGAQYNDILREAQRQIPGSSFTDWSAPTAPAATGIEFANPAAPAYTAPTLEQPAPYQAPPAFAYDQYQAPPEFAYDPYRATTAADMEVDPGYQFRLEEGQKALERTRAAQGIYRTGATLKALTDYGQGAASQEFGNVDARRRADYATNYGVARDIDAVNRGEGRYAYEQNYGVARDIDAVNRGEGRYGYEQAVGASQRGYDAAKDKAEAEYAPNLLSWQTAREDANRAAELNFDRDWQKTLWTGDNAFRQQQADRDELFRNRTYDQDAAWRQYQLEEQRRQFLAEIGTRQ